MAAPVHSKDFMEKPPTCEQEMVTLNVPCKGKDDEAITITLNNPCADRVTYKLTGTKFENFKVAEAHGFCESKSSKAIEILPKAIKNSDGWTKLDNFVLDVAPAPKGDMWQAKEIWGVGSKAPTQIKTFKINIKCQEGE